MRGLYTGIRWWQVDRTNEELPVRNVGTINVVATLARAWLDVGNHRLATVATRMKPTVKLPTFLRTGSPRGGRIRAYSVFGQLGEEIVRRCAQSPATSAQSSCCEHRGAQCSRSLRIGHDRNRLTQDRFQSQIHSWN